jgi:hypothetical protein
VSATPVSQHIGLSSGVPVRVTAADYVSMDDVITPQATAHSRQANGVSLTAARHYHTGSGLAEWAILMAVFAARDS